MSKSNDTEEQQQIQAVSVSQAAGDSLRRMAQHHGVVTAFYPVSPRPSLDTPCKRVSQVVQRAPLRRIQQIVSGVSSLMETPLRQVYSPLDWSQALLLAMAVGTLVGGSLWAAADERAAVDKQRKAPDGADDGGSAGDATEPLAPAALRQVPQLLSLAVDAYNQRNRCAAMPAAVLTAPGVLKDCQTGCVTYGGIFRSRTASHRGCGAAHPRSGAAAVRWRRLPASLSRSPAAAARMRM